MAAIHPHDIESHPADDPWVALAACAARADELTAELQSLHRCARAAVGALGSEGSVPLEQVHAAHDALTAMARLRHAAVTAQTTTVPLAQRTEVRSHDAVKSARRWLSHHGGLSNAEAGSLVRAASAVANYDQVEDALDRGEITPAHADLVGSIIPARFTGDALTEATAKVRDAQATIVEQARQLPVNEFREFCDRVRDLLDTDGPGDPTTDPSSLHLSRTFHGRWILRGDLAPDHGALIATMIETQIERTKRANARDDAESAPEEPNRPHSELAAHALAQLLTAGAGAGRPGRVGLYLHLELADLLDARRTIADLVESSGLPHTELGLDISDDLLWALMCGGDVIPVFTLDGTPLSYGRTRRLAPDVLAHILRHRDRSCTFPTCNAPPLRLQNHHIIHWDDQGTTDPHNLTGLCRAHHADHHTRSWGIQRHPDGTLHITRPDGTTFTARERWRT